MGPTVDTLSLYIPEVAFGLLSNKSWHEESVGATHTVGEYCPESEEQVETPDAVKPALQSGLHVDPGLNVVPQLPRAALVGGTVVLQSAACIFRYH